MVQNHLYVKIQLVVCRFWKSQNDFGTDYFLLSITFSLISVLLFPLQNSPFGEAYGISTSSLQRLTTVYGSKPERHLLGFLVRVVEAQNDETLLFLHDMCHLYKASRYHTMLDTHSLINNLSSRITESTKCEFNLPGVSR